MNKKPLSEKETRKKLFNLAKSLGCDIDLKQIMDRYDKLLKNSFDPKERKQIAILGNVEIHKLFNFRNALVIDDKIIIPGDPDYKESE